MIKSKYEVLVDILDKIRDEVKPTEDSFVTYNPPHNQIEKLNHARSRAYIHLLLKVSFGLLDFRERERQITDGPYDGGIDGYHINKENKTIYFIQSKFRITEGNFENKKIGLDEILVMDINRILEGEKLDEQEIPYNGKILRMQQAIKAIEDIGRYTYKVVLLANLAGWTDTKLRQLTGGYSTEVFDSNKTYEKLVFPIITGTFFNASDVNINIDLSNKNAGSKISYTVLTKKGECEITVLFVPTIEIGRIMYKYKNSILKYNPRSYLDLEGKKVNNAITETIVNKATNEFALFNNGITMLSDETLINEKIGQKNKAQLVVKNPQIINGGQTSYTLSRIYHNHEKKDVEQIFQNKEVLLKIITLLDRNDEVSKVELIEDISTATNQQTPVIGADRFANEAIHLEIQKLIFDRYGLLYERKRGGYADGLMNGYIKEDQIIERNLFFRMYYSSNGFVETGKQKKLFLKQKFTSETLKDIEKLDNTYFGYLFFRRMFKYKNPNNSFDKIAYAQVRAYTILYKPATIDEFSEEVEKHLESFKKIWKRYYSYILNEPRFQMEVKNKKTGEIRIQNNFNATKYFDSAAFKTDLLNFIETLPSEISND